MRITFLLQDSGSIYGAERATLDLLSGLTDHSRVEVSVLLIEELRARRDRSEFAETLRRTVPCEALPTRSPCSLPLIRSIRRHLRTSRADCLHTVGYKATLHGGLAGGFGRVVPCVTTVHGWLGRRDWRERLYRWADLRAMRRFQRVVALSRHYETLLRNAGVPEKSIVRIPSGLDLRNGFCARRRGDDEVRNGTLVVGILGRLSTEKNHEMFLNVARNLVARGKDIEFIMAGDGPERGPLLNRIQTLGLEGRVRWEGFVARDDFFSRIDVLTVCSHIENLPYVILEAMAWSVPVVATRVGGVPDLITDSESGCLVEVDDVDGMASAIAHLCEHEGLRRMLGVSGRRRLETEFTLPSMISAHVGMYREVVNAGG